MMLHNNGKKLRFNKISDRIPNHSLFIRKKVFHLIKIQLCKTAHQTSPL